MEQFTITVGNWAPGSPSPEVPETVILYINTGGIHFPVNVQITRTLHDILKAAPDGAPPRGALLEKMLEIALPKLKAKLNHLPLPKTSTDAFLLTETFHSGDADLFKRALPVECQFQEQSPTGLLCRAAATYDELKGKTTSAVCAACDLPSDALRCTNLQHPGVFGKIPFEEEEVRRQVLDAFCDIKTASFQHRECIPGGNDCWRQEIDNSEKISVVMDDIAERVIDELQYLNLSFRQAFGRSLVRLNDLRLVSQLLSTCHTQEDFTTKVACLADILNNLDLSNFAEEIDSDVKGSLNRFQTFLKARNVPLDEHTIETLKHIVSIRK